MLEVAIAQDVQVFTVNEPPANYINGAGAAEGYVVDIVNLLQKKVGNRSKVIFLPEARALEMVKETPNVLFFSLSKTVPREENYHWIGQVMSKKWQVYALESNDITINNLRDLENLYSIGIVRGDVREEWLQSQNFTNLHSVTQHNQNILRLLMGRVPVIVYEEQGLAYFSHEMGIDFTLFKPVYTLRQSAVYIVMSKATPTHIVKLWQDAFEQLTQSGEIKKISLAWQQKLKQEFNISSEISKGILFF